MLLPWLAGWEQPRQRTTFAAGLHAGSCAGIAWALRAELRALRPREVLALGAVSVPAAVAGLVAADAVEHRLGRPPQLAALLAGAGALMWWVDARATPDAAGPTTTASPMITSDAPGVSGVITGVGGWPAAAAALAQVAALAPGVSRSGASLTALRAAGVDRAAAERFSLVMSLPVTAGAACLTLARADRQDLRELSPGLAAGAVTAAVAAALTTRRLTARPGRPLAAAALYRLGLAAVVAVRLRSRRDRS